MRSPARSAKLTIEQMGAIVAYASYDLEALRWVLGMIATGCRPDAVLQWDVAAQWGERGPNFDTQPKGWPVTKKRNAVVPVIPEFRPWLEAWADFPHRRVRSRKTWWRTMRAALDLPPDIVPKTIRHSIATELRGRGVPMDEIAGLLGHVSDRRITQGYAKYDPSRLPHAKRELSIIWQEVCATAQDWFTNQFRVTPSYGQPIVIAPKPEKAYKICEFENGGR
jgi:integrase